MDRGKEKKRKKKEKKKKEKREKKEKGDDNDDAGDGGGGGGMETAISCRCVEDRSEGALQRQNGGSGDRAAVSAAGSGGGRWAGQRPWGRTRGSSRRRRARSHGSGGGACVRSSVAAERPCGVTQAQTQTQTRARTAEAAAARRDATRRNARMRRGSRSRRRGPGRRAAEGGRIGRRTAGSVVGAGAEGGGEAATATTTAQHSTDSRGLSGDDVGRAKRWCMAAQRAARRARHVEVQGRLRRPAGGGGRGGRRNGDDERGRWAGEKEKGGGGGGALGLVRRFRFCVRKLRRRRPVAEWVGGRGGGEGGA